jgi:hypothetical protein
LVIKTFNSEIQRPSPEKLWQIPMETALPVAFDLPFLFTPEDVQATSYLAASARI